MRKQPDAVFIIDLKKEALAVREARRLGLPVIALVDTNCDPDEADFVVPGNDDAIRACALITRVIADSIAEGQQKVSPKDFQPAVQENGAAPVVAATEEPAAAAAEPEAPAALAEPEPEAPAAVAEPEPEAPAAPAAEPEPEPEAPAAVAAAEPEAPAPAAEPEVVAPETVPVVEETAELEQ
jgi:small subunit ribosomal protein S2